jgi:hypothetical protein
MARPGLEPPFCRKVDTGAGAGIKRRIAFESPDRNTLQSRETLRERSPTGTILNPNPAQHHE